MKINNYIPSKSSFLSVDKDMAIIANTLMKNERLKRLLYYQVPDALNQPNLTEDQTLELIDKNIKIVPKLIVDKSVLSYVIINFDNFVESSNPQFRDNIIEFDIICHFDSWKLKDFALRPYKIAGEIDSSLNNANLTGIGQLEFLGANQLVLTDEFGGICLMYKTYHGDEDKQKMPNPMDEERFQEDFKQFLQNN